MYALQCYIYTRNKLHRALHTHTERPFLHFGACQALRCTRHAMLQPSQNPARSRSGSPFVRPAARGRLTRARETRWLL